MMQVLHVSSGSCTHETSFVQSSSQDVLHLRRLNGYGIALDVRWVRSSDAKPHRLWCSLEKHIPQLSAAIKCILTHEMIAQNMHHLSADC